MDNKIIKILFMLGWCLVWTASSLAETGYDLWLRYPLVEGKGLRKEYVKCNSNLMIAGEGETIDAVRDELRRGFSGMTGTLPAENGRMKDGTVMVGAAGNLQSKLPGINLSAKTSGCGDEGYAIFSTRQDGKRITVITGNTDRGVLYGTFHYLRLMQTGSDIRNLDISESPKLTHRVLNHWDNLNGTVERGYAGYSLWNWERLPYIKPARLTDYARANASIGINGIVLNNVNAKAVSLRHDWLVKAAGLAEVFRPYGIKVYLTAKFSAPKEIGGLKSADPCDPEVRRWWRDKAKEIYALIPDFGGFLVKANSEGQPGPQDYGRTHAEGANMLGEALEPFGGVVFWRAFVYQNERDIDRAVTNYNEFKPLDGAFMKNVFVQPKNGPIDFQPREPFHPLFGAMPATPLAMEVQITQENLGHAGHLVYLGSLYEEVLQSDTHAGGEVTTVSKVLQNYGRTHGMSGIAGVPNVGTDQNWTGHPFGQANWYAFGRLAWNPDASSSEIAKEWISMTFSNDAKTVEPIHKIMMMSRETYVNYTMPLGLNHIMNYDTHNGPEPWHHDPWWSAYDYHRITADSIGVDRTWCAASDGHTGVVGSGATRQYQDKVFEMFDNLETCPDEYLLWFHRLPFSYRMRSGKTLWEELVAHYYRGVEEVDEMARLWDSIDGIDSERHKEVAELLQYQKREAEWWRDGCLLFFRSHNGLPLPSGYAEPEHTLDYYKRIPFPYDWDGTY